MPKTLSEPTIPNFTTNQATLDQIKLVRAALPLGPCGHELMMHLIYDLAVAATVDQGELDGLLESFCEYAVNDVLPPGTPAVSELIQSLWATSDKT